MTCQPPSAPSPPLQAYGVFSDNINQATVQRIFVNFAGAMERKFTHVHLLFHSIGGTPGDGICLYNFFKSLPLNLTIYNAGTVHSAAVIAYLGAKQRKTSARGTFMIHRVTSGSQFTTAARLKGLEKSLDLDDERMDSILREHIKLSETEWNKLDLQELYFSGGRGGKNRDCARDRGVFSTIRNSDL
jgi:ATP-dependent Clp protease protease subunit